MRSGQIAKKNDPDHCSKNSRVSKMRNPYSRFNIRLIQVMIFMTMLVVSLEFGSFVLVSNGLLLVNEVPKAYRDLSKEGGTIGSDWWTERDIWGAWRKRNARAVHTTTCFQVEYASNSFGARDNEFSEGPNSPSPSRLVLLGDSFAEGFGVDFDTTAQRYIEKFTEFEVLNFGSAGDFGPLQYWLVYKNLAIDFDHDGVIVFLLPANDFTDNDYSVWHSTGRSFLPDLINERHRPYWRAHAYQGTFDYFLPDNALKRDQWGYGSGEFDELKSFLVNWFWSANILRTVSTIRHRLINHSKFPNESDAPTYSGYFDATEEQQQAVVYFIKRIGELSAGKNLLIVSIPTISDITAMNLGKNLKDQYWWATLKDLSKSSNGKITFLDLMGHIPETPESLFLGCDGHWSSHGNYWAATHVSDVIKTWNNSPKSLE